MMLSPRTIAVVILAAGGSSRLGRPKQLEPIDGEPLIRRQVRVAIDSGLGPVGAVLGGAFDPCVDALKKLDASMLRNEAWAEGLSTSLKLAVTFAEDRKADALIILLGDQFAVTSDDLRSLVNAWHHLGPEWTIATRHGKSAAGPPALFPAARFDLLNRAVGDQGAKQLFHSIRAVHRLDIDAARYDLDTEADVPADSRH